MHPLTTQQHLEIRRAPDAPLSRPHVVPDQWVLPLDGSCALAATSEVPSPSPRALTLVPDSALPQDLEPRAQRFVQALVEITAGVRPVNQMSRWMTSEVYDGLVRRLGVLGRARSRSGPVAAPRARVVSVHVTQPRPGSAEVTARVAHGSRSRALAARLDLVPDLRGNQRWTCTALEWG